MALLAFGYYFNAALGFNADTLRVYGRLRYTVVIDFISMVISVGLSLILIPRYGPMGAALGTCGSLVLYNILNHIGLRSATRVDLFRMQFFRVYASVILGAVLLYVFQYLVSAPIFIDLILAGLISLIVLVINRRFLEVALTFPELLRFPIVRFIFETHPKKAGIPHE